MGNQQDQSLDERATAALQRIGWTPEQIKKILAGPERASIYEIAGRKVGAAPVQSLRASTVPDLPAKAESEKASSSPPATDRKVPLYWSKASIVLSDAKDPYNQEYAEYVKSKERSSRDLNSIGGGAGSLATAIAGTVLSALSSTGVGAIVAVVWQALNLIGKYVVPPSEGGWEKLTALQRQRAQLYQLLPDFEVKRNQTVFDSQRLDLSVQDIPGKIHDPAYALYIRNRLIRGAYAAEFKRVANTPDEPMLPAPCINILTKARMWPPPLPPLKPIYFGTPSPEAQWKYFGLSDDMPRDTDFDRMILKIQYDIVYNQYMADIQKFSQVASLAIMPDDLRELAMKYGSIPELGAPGVFTFSQDLGGVP